MKKHHFGVLRGQLPALVVGLLLFCFGTNLTAQSNSEILIGAPYTLTGWAGPFGDSEAKAAQMAVDEVNAAGGILGKKIRLIVEDTRSEQREVATAIKKLLEVDKVKIIIGPNFAEFSEVAAPIAEARKILMLSATGYTDTLTSGRRWVFSMQPGHAHSSRPLSRYVLTKNHKKIAVITAQTAFFELFSGAYSAQLQGDPKLQIERISIKPDERDFRSMLLRLKRDNFDAVTYFGGVSGEAADFYRQLKAINYTPAVYGTEYIALDPVIKENPSLAEGTVYLGYFAVAKPDFMEKYKKRFAAAPQFSAPRAYDLIYVFKAAVERCQGDFTDIVRCVEATDYEGTTGRVKFQPNHTIAGEHVVSELWEIRGGKMIKLPK